MSTSFQFIDNSTLRDRRSRRAIRSHVMKGKNVGKVRKPRAVTSGTETSVIAPALGHGQQEAIFRQAKMYPEMLIRVGHEFSGLKIPGDITPRGRHFISEFMNYMSLSIYPAELCTCPVAIKSVWFQYLLLDEAYYHCLVALSEACIDFLVGIERYSHEFTYHMCLGLRLVNEKLSSSQALSDTSIATVISLCLIYSMRQLPVQVIVHFEGLCRLIELRGGLNQLRDNPTLVEKAHRIDIELALQLGCPTKLGPPIIRFECMTSMCGDQVANVESPLVYAAISCDSQMQDVVHKIITMTNLFNRGGAARKLQPLEFQNMVMSVSYQLLSIDSVDGSHLANPFSKGLHRGLLAFVATFLAHVGQQQRPHHEVLRRQFQGIFSNQNFCDSINPETYTWLLFAAGMSILDMERHAAWFKSRLSKALSKLDIMVWQSAYQVLRKYPWVAAIHDELALNLWRTCFGHVGGDT